MSEWRKGLRDLAAVMGKDDPDGLQELARLSARRFVKNVVDVTPPATGQADSAAQQLGEAAILDDLMRVAIPLQADVPSGRNPRAVLASAVRLLEIFEAARSRRTGRVPRGRYERQRVSQADFDRVLKQIQGRVGFLAAGLNAAAERLGVRLPPWIARHGTGYGKIDLRATAAGIKIAIQQNVPYAENVSGYERNWNFALQKEIDALHNQISAIVRKRALRAGFRLK